MLPSLFNTRAKSRILVSETRCFGNPSSFETRLAHLCALAFAAVEERQLFPERTRLALPLHLCPSCLHRVADAAQQTSTFGRHRRGRRKRRCVQIELVCDAKRVPRARNLKLFTCRQLRLLRTLYGEAKTKRDRYGLRTDGRG